MLEPISLLLPILSKKLSGNVACYLPNSRMYGSTSRHSWRLPGQEYPFPLVQEYVRIARDLGGASKLVFGTNFPGTLIDCTYGQAISYIRDHCDSSRL